VTAVILVVQGHLLAHIRLSSFVGMLALLVVSLAAGWLLGGPGSDNRKTLALTTSLRNVGVSLVIATGDIFAGTPAGPTVMVYGWVEIFGSLALALAWGRHASGTPVGEETKMEAPTKAPLAKGARPRTCWELRKESNVKKRSRKPLSPRVEQGSFPDRL
jgi:hypothetical protein